MTVKNQLSNFGGAVKRGGLLAALLALGACGGGTGDDDLFGYALASNEDGRHIMYVSDRDFVAERSWPSLPKFGKVEVPVPEGRVWAVDMQSNRVLFSVKGDEPGESFGNKLCAIADISGDGVSDLLIASYSISHWDNTRIRAVSGLDGAELWRLDLASGVSDVEAVGDCDGDGFPDFVIAQPLAGGSGVVSIRSGLDGSVISESHGSAPDQQYGWKMAVLGDARIGPCLPIAVLDGPSRSREAATDSTTELPKQRLHLLSGADLSPLWSLEPEKPNAQWDCDLSNAGDVNGDGVDDVLVGETQVSEDDRESTRVSVLSGADGARLQMWSGPNDIYAKAITGMGDLDGDGCSDIAIGSPDLRIGQGVIEVQSGRTGLPLYRIDDDDMPLYYKLGMRLRRVGDVDGDGVNDLLASAMCPHSCATQGRVFLYSGASGAQLRMWTVNSLRYAHRR